MNPSGRPVPAPVQEAGHAPAPGAGEPILDSRRSPSGVVAGGNWLVDHVKILDCWPPQDALAHIVAESWGNGGAPYNVLKDLARMQAPFPLEGIGLVGDDPDGERIITDCHAHGIDTRQLRKTTEAPTAYCDVMTGRATGRRTFFYQRGANARLAPGHFDFTVTNARIFHLGYLLLLDALDEVVAGAPAAVDVLRRARAAGLLTSLDCVSENSTRFESVVKPVLPEIDVLFVNDFEAEKLTGIAVQLDGVMQRHAVERAAHALVACGVRKWVMLHFPAGVYAAGPQGQGQWQPALRVPADGIRGAAGAGDAFAAGVLYGLHEAMPVGDALRLGVCVAAGSLSDATCSQGVLPVAQSLALATQFGFQAVPR